MLKIFYVTDIHGSEICWKKFLNAGSLLQADIVILGGDITGKAMVPSSSAAGLGLHASEQHQALEPRPRSRSSNADPESRVLPDPRLRRGVPPHAAGRGRGRQAVQGGHARGHRALDRHGGRQAQGQGHPRDRLSGERRHVRDRPILESGRRGVRRRGAPLDLEGFEIVSCGWTNPTPWHTFREPEEPELAAASPTWSMPRSLENTILNFHAPPYGTELDKAPALNEDLTYKSGGQALRPVGRRPCATRSRTPTVLSLHGHIHESKGAARIGKRLALNPGKLLRGGDPPGSDREHRPQEAEGEELSVGERLSRSTSPEGSGRWQR